MGSVTVVSRPRVDRGSGFWTSGFRLWGLGFRGLGFGVLGVGFVCRDNLLCFLHVEALGVEEQLEIHFPRLFKDSCLWGSSPVHSSLKASSPSYRMSGFVHVAWLSIEIRNQQRGLPIQAGFMVAV